MSGNPKIHGICQKCGDVSPPFEVMSKGPHISQEQWMAKTRKDHRQFMRERGWIMTNNPDNVLCPKCGAN